MIHDLPFVGENYFDHMNLPLFVKINETASVTKGKILSAGEMFKYLIKGTGVLS
jgi:choline dehydrogenase